MLDALSDKDRMMDINIRIMKTEKNRDPETYKECIKKCEKALDNIKDSEPEKYEEATKILKKLK